MIIHKCDICGKEMSSWINITVTVGANRSEVHVGDLINLQGVKEVCKSCCKLFEAFINESKLSKE